MICDHPRDKGEMTLSVVIPVYNEAEGLEKLYAELCRVLDNIGLETEFVFVDDGSADSSLEILTRLQEEDPRIMVIALSRNYGHQLAITAGLDHARGTAVVTMDADLQDPPGLIPDLLEKWRSGYDVVHAVRGERQGERFIKKVTASFFYRFLQKITKLDLTMDAGDFCLMDRRVVDAIREIRERHRYIRGIISWVGFRHAKLIYTRAPRYAGKSKYPLWQSLRFSIDAITTFSYFPLRLATGIGILVSLGGMAYGVYMIYLRLFTSDIDVTGWTALFVAVTFLGGLQLIVLGVIGEYIGRAYEEIRNRPLYYVSKIYRNESVEDGKG